VAEHRNGFDDADRQSGALDVARVPQRDRTARDPSRKVFL